MDVHAHLTICSSCRRVNGETCIFLDRKDSELLTRFVVYKNIYILRTSNRNLTYAANKNALQSLSVN